MFTLPAIVLLAIGIAIFVVPATILVIASFMRSSQISQAEEQQTK